MRSLGDITERDLKNLHILNACKCSVVNAQSIKSSSIFSSICSCSREILREFKTSRTLRYSYTWTLKRRNSGLGVWWTPWSVKVSSTIPGISIHLPKRISLLKTCATWITSSNSESYRNTNLPSCDISSTDFRNVLGVSSTPTARPTGSLSRPAWRRRRACALHRSQGNCSGGTTHRVPS